MNSSSIIESSATDQWDNQEAATQHTLHTTLFSTNSLIYPPAFLLSSHLLYSNMAIPLTTISSINLSPTPGASVSFPLFCTAKLLLTYDATVPPLWSKHTKSPKLSTPSFYHLNFYPPAAGLTNSCVEVSRPDHFMKLGCPWTSMSTSWLNWWEVAVPVTASVTVDVNVTWGLDDRRRPLLAWTV